MKSFRSRITQNALPPVLQRIKEFVYVFSFGRWLIHHFGRSVWRLPPILVRRLCFDEQLRRTPSVTSWEYQKSEKFHPIRLAGGMPTLGHRLVGSPYWTWSAYISKIPFGWLVGKHAAVVTDQGRVSLSAFRNEPRILALDANEELVKWVSERSWEQKPVEPAASDVCSFVGRLDANYYHWIAEMCAQIKGLELYESVSGRQAKILIRANGSAYMRESLSLLGISSDRIMEWQSDTAAARYQDLLVCSRSGNVVGCAPQSLKWLRERYLQGAGINATIATATRRIYLPRKPGGWRCVVNDDEVNRQLERAGFEIVFPHQLSFIEQVKLFSESRTVIGLHGAALANIIFAPLVTVFELFGNYGNGTYYSMCSGLNRPYYPIRCEPVGEDIKVDVSALLRAIKNSEN